VQNFIFF